MTPATKLRLAGGTLALVMSVLTACQAGSASRQPQATEGAVQSADQAGAFTLTSPEFGDGQSIPRRYACDGDNVSPPLGWTGAPGDAVAMTLVMDDPDAGGFIHWVVFDMTASASGSLPAGWSSSPDAPPQGTNSFGRLGYGGPCPPSGTHRYTFRLLALGQALAITGSPTAEQVLDAAAGHIIGEATLSGTYRKGG